MSECGHIDDALARRRLAENHEESFVVEAGAGTGKTTAIVERIVDALASGRLTMERLLAISFTEAAAAELRARIRARLEEEGRGGDGPRRDRCRSALVSIDDAAITTIHGLAARILRDHAIAAGLPASLEVLDEVADDLRRQETFRKWFTSLDGGSEVGRAVRHLLVLGVGPGQLAEIATRFADHPDLLETSCWHAERTVDPVLAAHRLGQDLGGRATDLGRRLLAVTDVDEALAELLVVAGAPERSASSVVRQSLEALGQFQASKAKDIVTEATKVIVDSGRAALCRVLEDLRRMLLEDAERRRSEGRATFADLLWWARNLLRDSPEIRRRLRERWRLVVVDEFQDTDPLQVEIVRMLTDEGVDPAGRTTPAAAEPWRPRPGGLCIIGDPKQSIYRFRRADLAVYDAARSALANGGCSSLALQSNFRSHPAILDVVNRHFHRVMAFVPGLQAAYVPLLAATADGVPSTPLGVATESQGDAAPSSGDATECAVHVVGGLPLDGARAAEVWEMEAEAVADALARAVGERWPVRDLESGHRRPATWRDCCVLLPTRTNLRRLERAFERRDIPFHLESAVLVAATQEVRDLCSALRAIDDPSDEVAVVAALRSPAYGCSDVELLQWRSGGGRFDDLGATDGGVDRVASALADLAERHRRRHDGTVARLVAEFVADRLLDVAALDDRRPEETWRRHRWVVDRARALAATGRTSLRAFCEWMDSLAERATIEATGPPPTDEDAVRIMTVHGAKGLEFPIVVVTGLGRVSRPRTPPVVPARRAGRLEVQLAWQLKKKGGKRPAIATEHAEEAATAEKAAEVEEDLRLLYVALTRARDHLVLPLVWSNKGAKQTGEHEHASAGPAAEALTKTLQDAARQGVPIDWTALPPPADGAPTDGRAPLPATAATSADEATGAVSGGSGLQVPPEVADETAWVARRREVVVGMEDAAWVGATALAHGARDAPAVPSEAGAGAGTVGEAGNAEARRKPSPSAAEPPAEDGEDTDRGADDDPLADAVRRGGRAATALGRAVHAVLQSAPLDAAPGSRALLSLATAQAVLEAIPDRAAEVARLAGVALASPPVEAARRARRRWREVPVAGRLGSWMVEGFVDLLYERDDGSLVVVDYKTDHVAEAEIDQRMEPYALQLATYALLLEAATQRVVVAASLVFAASGVVRDIADLRSRCADLQRRLSCPS